MGDKAKQKKPQKPQREKRAIFYGLLASALGFAALAYAVIAAEPNFYVGVGLIVTCGVFFVLAIWEFCDTRKTRVSLSIVVAVGTVIAVLWAHNEWGKITIQPSQVTFTASRPPQNYVFSVINRRADKYSVLVKFRLSKPALFFNDVSPQISGASLKPSSEGSRMADIRGWVCVDSVERQVLLLQIYRVTSREPRELSFSHKSQNRITLTSEITDSTETQPPRSADPNSMSATIKVGERLTCSSPVAFMTDNSARIERSELEERKNGAPIPPTGPAIYVYPDGRVMRFP